MFFVESYSERIDEDRRNVDTIWSFFALFVYLRALKTVQLEYMYIGAHRKYFYTMWSNDSKGANFQKQLYHNLILLARIGDKEVFRNERKKQKKKKKGEKIRKEIRNRCFLFRTRAIISHRVFPVFPLCSLFIFPLSSSAFRFKFYLLPLRVFT